MTNRYRLKLTSLKFISAVDAPAQETATAVLFKHANQPAQITATARVAKLSSDDLGLVFGWALTSKSAGSDYFDLHGDNIVEEDLIKVAAEFLAAGGATDAMHDDAADGKVIFAMPLTAEVAKAFGIQTETTGLMVAIKPSAEVFAKFKSGEYTGFSIAGQGERTLAKSAAVAIAKKQTLLAATAGHTHFLDDLGGAESGYTSCESMDLGRSPDGYVTSNYHSHPWSRDGKVITIGEAANHTHELPTTIDKVAPVDAPNSTPPIETIKVNTMTTKFVVLTEAQGAHHSTLNATDAEAFLLKSAADRESDVVKARAADPVIYTMSDGTEVRKSSGALAVTLAKRADESAKEAAKATELANVEKAARENTELRKRATDTIGNLAGSSDAQVALLKAAESIADEKLRGEAVTMLKAADAIVVEKGRPAGVGGTDDIKADGPQAEFDQLVAKHVTEHKTDERTARLAVSDTAKGRELYAEIEKSKRR